MDPIANIAEQHQIARRLIQRNDQGCEYTELADGAVRLADLVIALANWRMSGGFDPYARENR